MAHYIKSKPTHTNHTPNNKKQAARWNPKREQIRILESIFNSGLVNPSEDESEKIKSALEMYGKVGERSVFYWFHNQRTTSKKNLHLPKSQKNQNQSAANKAVAATTLYSSLSDNLSSKLVEILSNSPTFLVNHQQTFYGGGGGSHHQNHLQHHEEPFQKPYFFPVGQQQQQQAPPAPSPTSFTEGFSFSELETMCSLENQLLNSDEIVDSSPETMLRTDLMMKKLETIISGENHLENNDQTVVSGSEMLLTDLMINHQYGNPSEHSKNKEIGEESIMKLFTPSCSFTSPPAQPLATIAPAINDIQGIVAAETGKSLVVSNDMPFEMAVGPFNLMEVFSGDAVVIDSYGQTVMTNECDITYLQNGANYHLLS